MPGVYKIPMVRMTEMSDETPECKGLKVPRSEMGVWVNAQTVRQSRNGCYETPWHVTGVSKLSGPEGTPKGMYGQIELSEQGKAGSPLDCALPGFVDSKNEEKTERNAGYLVVSHSGGGMLRQGTRKGIRRTPANRGMRAHWVVKGLDISEDVCHGMCP